MMKHLGIFISCAFLVILSSCNRGVQIRATEMTFLSEAILPIDLLISPEDMPVGWESFAPITASDEYCYIDCSAIHFDAHTEGQSRASHQVGILLDPEEASRLFNKYVIPRNFGEEPSDWNYESEIADQYSFTCYTYQDSNETVCEWVGLYENYIVEFFSWIIPDKMSVSEMEWIIQRIETIMLTIVE